MTGTRAEYGLLSPVMKEIQSSGLQLQTIVTGMHLLREFGFTYREIEADGFTIDAKVELPLTEDDDPAGMVQSIGLGVIGIGRSLEVLRPDVVMILGDRVEAFAAAIAAAGLNIAVAHIHGGEVTRGGLDESMRHAITKLAHLHFAATKLGRERIIRLGERPERVWVSGAPGLDTLLNTKRLSRDELETRIGCRLQAPLIVLAQHPVSTRAHDAAQEISETLEALRSLGHQTICIYPNADAGGRRMIQVIESFREEPWLFSRANLDHTTFVSLLSVADVLVGNTSAGIIEAPSLRLPFVNIGDRQTGRERSDNVIDVPHDRARIRDAIRRALESEEVRARVARCMNRYGDGAASARIVEVLRSTVISNDLIQKQLAY